MMDYAKQHASEICEAMAKRNNYDKAKYVEVAERLYKPSQLEKAKERAEEMMLAKGISYAVVEIDKGHYQVWAVEKVGNNHVYVAEYVEEAANK